MRRPTARMTPTAVQIQRWASWSKDAANARQPQYAPVDAATYYVAVAPANSVEVPDHMREQNVTYHRVNFHDNDVGLHVRDHILLGSRTLNVTGYYRAAERGRSFVAICEERLPA